MRAPVTMAGALAIALRAVAAEAAVLRWPSPIYADRPVSFVREVLRVRDPDTGELVPAQLLSEQERILQALAAPNARVSVTSGHKCGKDFIASLVACWFFCSFEGARVHMTAPSARQVNGITYRETRARIRDARHAICKASEVGELAATGVVAADLREIKGFTAKTPEAVAGISGAHVLYIVTEASGVEDPIFEAIEGNLAGADARILLITNPTRRSGYFYDSHHKNAKQWQTFQLSSWEIARAQKREGRSIPGLATERWCKERLEAWGKDDSRYKVRVLGEFTEAEEDKVISLELIETAQRRWADVPVLHGEPLHVGVDAAHGGRDEIAVVTRRGRKLKIARRFVEADEDRAADIILQDVLAEMAPGETGVTIKVDKGGQGWKLVVALRRAARRYDPTGQRINVLGIDFGWHPRHPQSYLCLRDELWFAARDWLKDGGTIPPDEKLEGELLAPTYHEDARHRLIVESKDKIRKRLGRSTDSADGAILAIWPHGETREWAPPTTTDTTHEPPREPGNRDVYSAMRKWERR